MSCRLRTERVFSDEYGAGVVQPNQGIRLKLSRVSNIEINLIGEPRIFRLIETEVERSSISGISNSILRISCLIEFRGLIDNLRILKVDPKSSENKIRIVRD
jgi:hypothetical protein